MGGIVCWADDWDERSDSVNGGLSTVALPYHLFVCTPLIEAQFFTRSDWRLARHLDVATRKRRIKSAADFAGRYRPRYFGLVYKDPSDIPADYYSEIRGRTTKPVAFSEIGYNSAPTPDGWESSEDEQARFVRAFFNLGRGAEFEFVIWIFMYDQDTAEPFESMGLVRVLIGAVISACV